MEDTQRLAQAIHEGDVEKIESVLASLEPGDVARAVCDLSDEDQATMLTTLAPLDAAELIEEIPEVEAIEVVSLLTPETAAAIVLEMSSDRQADLVGALDEDDADAVLAAMEPEEARQITELAANDPDTAGGLMATEFVGLSSTDTVGQVLEQFRRDAEGLRQLEVQYAYVTDPAGRLVGVMRLRDFLLAEAETKLSDLMIANPLSVVVTADLEQLQDLFEAHAFLGVPVVDEAGVLMGVVSRSAVDEATQDQAVSDYRRSQGLVEEELRSLPTLRRSRLRLAWLSINILLNVLAASVIATYQDTLAQVIALAVFLPMISDMSGCSGNQAVAVSMRELSLGLLRPSEYLRVWAKEATVGLINGTALGALLGFVAWGYSGNGWLGLVVGLALGLNTLVAVLIGGAMPLVLKSRGVDPALASGPILTTVTDMVGFFLVLSLAASMLPLLV